MSQAALSRVGSWRACMWLGGPSNHDGVFTLAYGAALCVASMLPVLALPPP